MLENITCQISESNYWFNTFSFTFQLIGSFLIAYFTVQYTHYLREKREFESAIDWFIVEGSFLRGFMDSLKITVNQNIKKMDKVSDKKNLEIIYFPDFSINSIDFFISKGYVILIKREYSEQIIKIKLDVLTLKYNHYCYVQLLSIAPQITAENYNEQMRSVLTNINENIDRFNTDWDNRGIFQYPKTFLASIWS